ncbi:unnamed protein product [Sphagnum jensenii]|uniref:Uncharacterized protein n=1 Tax=Sphagnum jensenii TaxID=128206 RepID=A0ABP1ACZ6_9BRYO
MVSSNGCTDAMSLLRNVTSLSTDGGESEGDCGDEAMKLGRGESEESRNSQGEENFLQDQLRAATQSVQNMQRLHEQSKEVSSHLEASLSAKEKIISELCFELNAIENALLSEHEQHLLESKRLNSLINEKGELNELPTAKQVEDLQKQVKILQIILVILHVLNITETGSILLFSQVEDLNVTPFECQQAMASSPHEAKRVKEDNKSKLGVENGDAGEKRIRHSSTCGGSNCSQTSSSELHLATLQDMVQDVGLQSLRTSTTPKVSPPQSVILSGITTTRPGKKKRVQYHKLFSFADRIDCMLMVAGTLGALAHGISVPVFFIFFSRLINDLGHSFGDVKRQTKEVSNVSDFDLFALLLTSSSSVS